MDTKDMASLLRLVKDAKAAQAPSWTSPEVYPDEAARQMAAAMKQPVLYVHQKYGKDLKIKACQVCGDFCSVCQQNGAYGKCCLQQQEQQQQEQQQQEQQQNDAPIFADRRFNIKNLARGKAS